MLTNSPVKDSNRYDVYESVDDARKGVSMGVMRLSSLCVKDFGLIGCGDVDFDSTGSCKFIARGYRIDDSLSVSYCSATLKTSRFLRDENGLVCVELLDTSGHAFSFGRDVYASHDDAETFASRIRNDAEVIAFSDARKAYDVHVHFDMCVRVEGVRASDEEEAERKAKDVAAGMNLDEYAECVGVTACVVEWFFFGTWQTFLSSGKLMTASSRRTILGFQRRMCCGGMTPL